MRNGNRTATGETGMEITVKQIENLKQGVWLSKSLGKGNGVFTVRRTADGVAFYFRYTLPDGKRDTYRFATYDKNGANGGITLARAKEKASELSRVHKDHPNLRLYLEEQSHLEQERINRERYEREVSTLAALLEGYLEWLTRQGKKRTAQDVRSIFRRRVFLPFPSLASMKASCITTPNMTAVVAAALDSGAGREAAKLRSYMSAAFSAALNADSDPTIPPCLQGFSLETNPAISVRLSTLKKFNRARDRCLTKNEFRAYWRKIREMNNTAGATLRLGVLLGGQRTAQLLRLQIKDVNLEDNFLTLYDNKGRRTAPRRHDLPLIEPARMELLALMDINQPFVFSSTRGKIPLNETTLSNCVLEISKKMLAEGAVRELFQLRDIRRTIETILASMAVSKDVRAQLQSHGLSGVQDKHYDKYLYFKEKLAAMEMIYRCLVEEQASIVPLRSATMHRHQG